MWCSSSHHARSMRNPGSFWQSWGSSLSRWVDFSLSFSFTDHYYSSGDFVAFFPLVWFLSWWYGRICLLSILCFAGTTFIAGTSLYFYPDLTNSALISAWLYIVGSIGFLTVVPDLFKELTINSPHTLTFVFSFWKGRHGIFHVHWR